ncbi:MAG: carboxypeptidase regulatory-like domain-containing protein [Candidatus Kapaibacteriales bacterium]
MVDFKTQQPIAGASIFLQGTGFGAVSGNDGSYIIKNAPTGRYIIVVSSIGYEMLSQQIVLTSGRELIQDFQMNETWVESEEVVVTASRGSFETVNESAVVSSTLFTVEQVERYAGSRADPARAAQTYAGVVTANDNRNDIIIRGGSPTELLWRLDGLDIPNPNHFATQGATGGPISVINSRLLDNSDFLTGAFPAEYGDKMSGVFDLRTRSGNKDKYEYIGQFGFNGLEFGAEGPIGENVSFIANYRYSFLDILEMIGVDFGFAGVPRYQDFNAKIDWRASDKDNISLTALWGIGEIDINASEEEEVVTGDEDVLFGSGVTGVALNWKRLWTEKSYGRLTLGTALSNFYTYVDSIVTIPGTNTLQSSPGRFYENVSTENYLNAKYAHYYAPDKRHYISTGAEARYRFYDIRDERIYPPDYQGFRYQLLADGNAMQYLGYVNWNWRITEALVTNIGIHSQYLEISDKATLEPRFGLSYQLTEGQKINAGVGVHRQSLPLQVYFANENNRNLDFMQSIHYVGGYSTILGNIAQLKIEGYYKDISNAPVENIPSTFSFLNLGADFGSVSIGDLEAVSEGLGKAWGAELTLNKQFANGWYGVLTGSYTRQRFKASDGIWRWGGFDNIYIANLLGGYEWKISDEFVIESSIRWTVAGGSPIVPVDVEASRAAGETELDFNRAYEERRPVYNKFDIKIDFRQDYTGFSIVSFISIENVLNNGNPLGYRWNNARQEVQPINQLGFFPIGGFRIEF